MAGRGLMLAAVLAVVPCAAAVAAPTVEHPRDAVPDGNELELAGTGGHLVWSDVLPDAEGTPRIVVLHRAAGRTRLLPIAGPGRLDVGRAADGSVRAVYERCPRQRPCGVFAYDLRRDTERRVGRAGPLASFPTVWGGAVAFARLFARAGRDQVLLAPLHGGEPRTLFLGDHLHDLELGPRAVATISGATTLRVHARRGGARRTVVHHPIGRSCSAAVGALQYDGPVLFWKQMRGCGCADGRASFWRLRRGVVRRLDARSAPAAVRFTQLFRPETVASAKCGEG